MINKYRILMAYILIAVVALSCARTAQFHSEDTSYSLTHDGIERPYILHVPSSYDGKNAVALVLDFHGGGGNANSQMRTSNFSALARETCLARQ